jgi:transposase
MNEEGYQQRMIDHRACIRTKLQARGVSSEPLDRRTEEPFPRPVPVSVPTPIGLSVEVREQIIARILDGVRSPKWKVNLDPVAAMTLYRHGYTLGAIAKHFDCSPKTVRKAVVHFPDYKRLAKEQQASGRAAAIGSRKRGALVSVQRAREAWQFYLEGHSVPQVAAYFEVRRGSIRRAFHQYYRAEYGRLKQRGCEHDKHFSRELAWLLFQKGLSLGEVASRFRVTRSAIRAALSRIDGYQEIVDERTKVFDSAMAWRLYQQGWTTKRIGQRFGYHAKTVQRILRREYEGYDQIATRNQFKNLELCPNRIGAGRGRRNDEY